MRQGYRPALLLAGLLLLGLAGCGRDTGLNKGGKLTGKVLLDGEPLKGGTVTVVSQDGKYSASGFITGEGTYTVPEPPLGKVKISVRTSHLRGMSGARQGKTPATGSRGIILPDPKEQGLEYKAIPDHYEKHETSGLTCEVKRGEHVHDLTLTSKGQ